MTSNLITPSQAAEYLCVSVVTLRKWRWEGKGPKFLKLGRKVVYRETDIHDWLNEQVRHSTSDQGEVLR